MTRPFTVQTGYFIHFANTVTVEAQTLEEALEKAVAAANENPEGWKGTDHVTDSFVDAACEGAGGDPWGEGALPVPDRFTERGEPPRGDANSARPTRTLSKSPVARPSSALSERPARQPRNSATRRIRPATSP